MLEWVVVERGRRSDGKWSHVQKRELGERTVRGKGSRRSTFCRSFSVSSHESYNGEAGDLPVGFCRDEFGDGVRESRERTDVKDGE